MAWSHGAILIFSIYHYYADVLHSFELGYLDEGNAKDIGLRPMIGKLCNAIDMKKRGKKFTTFSTRSSVPDL